MEVMCSGGRESAYCSGDECCADYSECDTTGAEHTLQSTSQPTVPREIEVDVAVIGKYSPYR